MAEIFNIKKALTLVGNDTELLKELMTAFVNDKGLELSKLVALEASQDKEEAAKYVHYYKGAGRQLCAEVLAEEGQKLEDVLRKRSEGNIEKLNNSFLASYKEAVSEIKDALELL